MSDAAVDLEFLKGHVPEFEGYQDEVMRHRTDQRVRAWAGSRLAEAAARLAGQISPEVDEALQAAIFRFQFPDQIFVTRLDVACVDPELEQRLARDDRQLVELAERAYAAQSAELPAILQAIAAAFERRRADVPAPDLAG